MDSSSTYGKMSMTQTSDGQIIITRPIANFHPCPWGHHFLNITLQDEIDIEQDVQQLKLEVGELFEKLKKAEEKLNFVDTLERLGVAYHFEKEIDESLKLVYESFDVICEKVDLNQVSLAFRILRQHGFYVPCGVFNKFKDENGGFKESLTKDVAGMLSLFEACHVRVHDDKILDEALVFTTSHLTSMATDPSSPLAEQVAHALHQPLHKGMPRVEARFFISIYEKDPSHDNTLLTFAKLDFNLLQSFHQNELKDLTRWWKGLHMKASFGRDRMTEAYFWILGVYFEPQFSFARKIYRKVFKSTSLLDDTYDAYGSIEELKLLTQTFQRPWDKRCIDELPDNVKWCYYAYVEASEEAEKDLAEEGRAACVDYVRQQVKALCEAYFQEAKWCHQKYIPTYEEYMKNAIVTSPYPLAYVGSIVGMGEIASKECLQWACQNPMPDPIKAASTIIRLMNDMGGHKFEQSRNHVASAVECLMEHNAMSEEEANEMLTKQVDDAWKVVNQAMMQPYVIPKPLLTRILNLARSADVIYKGRSDGYTHVNPVLQEKIASVLAQPIPM